MNDDNRQDRPEQTESAGTLLRKAREAKGLSIQAVADALNLRAEVVDDLENDRHDRLPPTTFVRGYLRSYARVVDVKEYAVLAAYEQAQGVVSPSEQPLPRGGAIAAPAPAASGGGRGWLWLLIPIIALVAWFAYQGGLLTGSEPAIESEPVAEQAPPVEQPAAEPPVDEQGALPPPVAEPAAEESPLAATDPTPSQPAEQAAAEQPAVAPAPVAVEEPAAAPEPAAASALRVEVDGESWLQIDTADGRRLQSGVVRGPRSLEFTGEPPFRVVIGDASQVRLSYRGEPVALPTRSPGRVLRMTVPRS